MNFLRISMGIAAIFFASQFNHPAMGQTFSGSSPRIESPYMGPQFANPTESSEKIDPEPNRQRAMKALDAFTMLLTPPQKLLYRTLKSVRLGDAEISVQFFEQAHREFARLVQIAESARDKFRQELLKLKSQSVELEKSLVDKQREMPSQLVTELANLENQLEKSSDQLEFDSKQLSDEYDELIRLRRRMHDQTVELRDRYTQAKGLHNRGTQLKYDFCPNNEPFETCTHEDLKQAYSSHRNAMVSQLNQLNSTITVLVAQIQKEQHTYEARVVTYNAGRKAVDLSMQEFRKLERTIVDKREQVQFELAEHSRDIQELEITLAENKAEIDELERLLNQTNQFLENQTEEYFGFRDELRKYAPEHRR